MIFIPFYIGGGKIINSLCISSTLQYNRTKFLLRFLIKKKSKKLVGDHQTKLQLSEQPIKRWAGKRYIVLVEIANIESVTPFDINKSQFGNMDDRLPVGNIESIKQ